MKKSILPIVLLLLLPLFVDAHTINYQLEDTKGDLFWQYLSLGFSHIIPLGLDHILFILCIFLLQKNLKMVLWQASMFTLAHTITLGLSMYGYINPPGELIEPLIAFSIVLLAIENILVTRVTALRMALVFLFGLVHGMGFAGALSDLGMPENGFAVALLSFNLGVELGQMAIIIVMYFLVSLPWGNKEWYRKKIVVPFSLIIAVIALYWTAERIFLS